MPKIKIKAIPEAQKRTVSSAKEDFLRHCRVKNLSARTVEYYGEDLNYFMRCVPVEFVEEITKEVLEGFILHEMDKGNKVTAINSRIRGIRVFLKYCAEREWMEGFKLDLLKEDQTVKEPYTDAELKRLLKRPKSNHWTEWRSWATINTFLATGIRASTLVNIRIMDVDFTQDTIFLKKLKNRKQQTVPISKALKDALLLYLKLWDWSNEDFLFPSNTNTQLSVHALESDVRRYNISRGVTKTSLHLFRHTFAKNYILAGGGMVQLQAILGHSTLDMTRKYVNLYGRDIHRDFDRLNPLNNIMIQE